MKPETLENSAPETWCDRDQHKYFENYSDFNEWLDNRDDEQATEIRKNLNIDDITTPSKALYAGDRTAYEQVFSEYRESSRNEALNQNYLREQFDGDHWFERNSQRFEQLLDQLEAESVVPFIGAGLSKEGGFPTWKEHLLSQARTAGLTQNEVGALLTDGQYEEIIALIEKKCGRAVFEQEIRDVFGRTGKITPSTLLITELFADTVITTNYDRLLEQAFDTGQASGCQVLCGEQVLENPDPHRITIVKLHGDVKQPRGCILSQSQYNHSYGEEFIDMTRPIPKLIEYYYKNSSLLFLGSSLNNDRTVHVIKKIQHDLGQESVNVPQHFAIEQAPDTETELSDRNAYLAKLGITGIWFERNQFQYVEKILRLAVSELRYRKGTL